MKIKGAVVERPGEPFDLVDLDLAEPRADEVILRIRAVGLCHTDLTIAAGRGVPFPVVLGHEGAGVVEQVGSGVSNVSPGDRVVCSFASCGHCDRCALGHPAYCRHMWAENFGGTRVDGTSTLHRRGQPIYGNFFGQSSLATFAVCRARSLVPLEDDVPFELAAPLACGVQTGAGAVMNVLRPRPGQSFVVFGGGAVGLSALLAAMALGVPNTAVVEPLAYRRTLATDLGATAAFDPAEPDLVELLKEVSNGGFTTALDTSGRPEMLRTAIESLDGRGVLAMVATSAPNSELTTPLMSILAGRTVTGVTMGDSVPAVLIPGLIDLWRSGRFPYDRLCTTFPFEDVADVARAAQRGEIVKPVLVT